MGVFIAQAAGVITDAKPVSGILSNILSFLLSVVGVVGIIGVGVAALLYLTSAGSTSQIRRAKQVLFASVVGIGVALGSLVLANFIGTVFD